MTSFVCHTSIDCRDAYALSEWWKALLGYEDMPGDPNEPGHDECMIRDPETLHEILFIEVPEAKGVKNRIHLDLRPRSGTQEQEVQRALAAGATQLADLRDRWGPGTGWVVLADPEGNELCILRSREESTTEQPAGA